MCTAHILHHSCAHNIHGIFYPLNSIPHTLKVTHTSHSSWTTMQSTLLINTIYRLLKPSPTLLTSLLCSHNIYMSSCYSHTTPNTMYSKQGILIYSYVQLNHTHTFKTIPFYSSSNFLSTQAYHILSYHNTLLISYNLTTLHTQEIVYESYTTQLASYEIHINQYSFLLLLIPHICY